MKILFHYLKWMQNNTQGKYVFPLYILYDENIFSWCSFFIFTYTTKIYFHFVKFLGIEKIN